MNEPTKNKEPLAQRSIDDSGRTATNLEPPVSHNQEPRWRSLSEIVVGFLLGAFVICHYLVKQESTENYGLGDKTSTYQATDGQFLTHVIQSSKVQQDNLLAGWK